MSASGASLLAAAAGVGFGHAILPDHWVPLAVVGRTRRYPLSRIARLSSLAGVAHVLVSIVLGAVIIAIGLQFRSTIEHAQDTIIGCILIATGIGFFVFELTGHGHHHGDHDHQHGGHDHHHGSRPRRQITAITTATPTTENGTPSAPTAPRRLSGLAAVDGPVRRRGFART